MVAEGRQRIDKWLFFSRAVKSRSLAAKLVVAGRVRINRDKAAQASDLVKPGDVLTITLDRRIFVWKVLGAGVRRGPAEEARTLYEDMSPPPTPKGEALPDAMPALREAGSGRPTKRERRQTDRLLGED
ncbi:RNA-binding protein [Mesorhizobium sp. WSM4312]|uniref:RNA-binding S4 domain-containing protein n=1 Tax=unclassified Mesorhizobium TaxID=325217 RepID=UPI000BB06A72|nr:MULTISPECIES: RNA-binding S4 domain-containing protein [unclassified Mesorhizobium]PBB26500.1 RNA-binding protein [Mesorhizobium sp. WSM4304]PBB68592.1 RNA-binding protein [Mesorhizobium sp. WSM4312]PBB76267.1 RNA-binding protein [Mesorhizobium sp. WSM4308]PBC19923.1 RNA-binding protein [Mesorhizobium sp. WSM4311]TRC76981.1 RNA-binding S4 domain-containing protein [Mesorhizobium sp. WSM4315]